VIAKLPCTPIAGVVACPAGWLVQPAGLIGVTIMPEAPLVLDTLIDVIDYRPTYKTIVLGAPIGLAAAPNGGYRTCDMDARSMLGWPQRTMVPRVPSAAGLRAANFDAAQALEPWLTPLAYRRFRRWREIDDEIQPCHQRRVFSAVPELSFLLRDRLPGSPRSSSSGRRRVLPSPRDGCRRPAVDGQADRRQGDHAAADGPRVGRPRRMEIVR